MRKLVTTCIIALLTACSAPEPPPKLDVSQALGGSAEGYTQAFKARAFKFPADHNAHPDFRNEWWYITGNLSTKSGREFGYQVTFFRTALHPENIERKSNWGTRQVWMAHVALSDARNSKHHFDERWVRGAAGLAGNTSTPFSVWVEDWRLSANSFNTFPWNIQVETQDFSLHLSLTPLKPPVLQGDQGLSQKSSEPGNASYYYSIPRMKSHGQLQVNGEQFEVSGLSWLDREWSTSALGKDQAGWDWFSLQLQDGRDLMFYQLRKKDGSIDPYSSGTLIDKEGKSVPLKRQEIEATPLTYWTAEDGTNYPVKWHLNSTDHKINFIIKPLFNNQLMRTTLTYWEGAVQVFDAENQRIIGKGYLEMTGY